MIVDSSAAVAIVGGEPVASALEGVLWRHLAAGGNLSMSAVNVLGTRVVLHRRFAPGTVPVFEALLANLAVDVRPFDAIQASHAFAAREVSGRTASVRRRRLRPDGRAYGVPHVNDGKIDEVSEEIEGGRRPAGPA